MIDLHNMLPKDKCDTEQAQALVALGYPAVKPVLPELMEWIQDINWPVAHVIAPFLATIGLPLVPYIRQVFATSDEMWKIWVLYALVEMSPAIFNAVQEDVQRIADTPPQNEDQEALQEAAREVLEHYGVG